MPRQRGEDFQEDYQDFNSLPDTQDLNANVDAVYSLPAADDVEDSGMEAGVESQSDDDIDENDDMIVLDPEHVSCYCCIRKLGWTLRRI